MASSQNYHNGLLYLAHLIITADGIIDKNELQAMENIKVKESIPDEMFAAYKNEVGAMKEKEIYQKAIDLISSCDYDERLRAFAWLYKISEVDGNVHVKEVRFLLYSVKKADVEFDDVVQVAKGFPAIL